VELDISQSTLPKKIRNAQVMQFNYILVAGNEESELGVVEVRNARLGDKGRIGKMKVDEFADLLRSEYPKGVSLPRHIKF
jgi:threonyl-tRNA synthetase